MVLELVTILNHVYNSAMFESLISTRIPVYLAIVVHFCQSLLLFFFSPHVYIWSRVKVKGWPTSEVLSPFLELR